MSADHYIYTDYLDEFDRADFAAWCRGLSYEVELHPDFSIRGEGFAPIRFRAEFLGEGSFATGFELFSSENESEDLTAYVYEPPVKKLGFFAKLFGKKPQPVRTAQPPVFKMAPEEGEMSPFEEAVREKKWEVCATCHNEEPLTELMAYLFSAYFCEKFGAVIDDPQTGKWFTDPAEIRAEVEQVRRDMMAHYREWGVEFVPFAGWEQ